MKSEKAMNNYPTVLLMNPIEEGQDYVVDVDPVISRHTGGKTKIGIFPPLGMTYVAALLRQHKMTVKILDPVPAGYNFEQALKYASNFDVIVITLAASNAQGAYRFFSYLRDKVRIFMGTHATALADSILEKGYCDIIIRGEPEYTTLETVKNLHNLKGVLGVSYKSGGKTVSNKDRPLIENLDDLPFPARDLTDNMKYHIVSFPGKPVAMVLTSRGCPFECTFCATHLFYKRKRNIRSPEKVVQEVEEIVRDYGITHIFFIDDTFTIGEKRIIRLCELLETKNLKIEWICLGRVDTVTEPMLREMKKAGCKEVIYGIESASPTVLAKTKKNITREQMEMAVRITRELGIRVSLFFMFGNPGDTLESIRETSRLARKLNPNFASFNIATPDPGTPIFETIKDRFDIDTFETFDRLNTNFSMCEVSAPQLRRELVKAYLLYYGRPIYWFNLLRYLVSDPLNAPTMIRLFYRQAMSVLT
ncbi:MAG: radical SAM protein [Deltaproteobacteria bacterium]|nr:radical SAM protein [Deltaproteobacteria bacterium]